MIDILKQLAADPNLDPAFAKAISPQDADAAAEAESAYIDLLSDLQAKYDAAYERWRLADLDKDRRLWTEEELDEYDSAFNAWREVLDALLAAKERGQP